MFKLRSSTFSLRGTDILLLPAKISKPSYALNSFSWLAAKFWNALPDHSRTTIDFNSSRQLILSYDNIV